MINVTNHNCTGCRACEQLCPPQCISMKEDDEGFLIPKVDTDKCLDCGLCEKRCPQNNRMQFKNNKQEVYAFRYCEDDAVLRESSSGGAFPALAHAVIQRGGVIFGATFDENFIVKHQKVEKWSDIIKLQGSKYVQSDTTQTFSEVKSLLAQGVEVLYTGTPCQIAGLKAFLNNDHIGLTTIEVVCHGVASPLLFNIYISWLNETKGRLQKYYFRSKTPGWGTASEIKTESKSYLVSSNDPYNKAFMSGTNYRECCYECHYATPKRCADLTICDYWGIQKYHPEFFDTKGVSGVIVNTEKGKRLFEKVIRSNLVVMSNFDWLSEHNENLLNAARRPESRNNFYEGIRSMSNSEYINKFLTHVTFQDKVRALIPFRIKYWVKKRRGLF